MFAPLTRDPLFNCDDGEAKGGQKNVGGGWGGNGSVAFGRFYAPDEVLDTAAAT